jgi:hypothetical protein
VREQFSFFSCFFLTAFHLGDRSTAPHAEGPHVHGVRMQHVPSPRTRETGFRSSVAQHEFALTMEIQLFLRTW